MLEAHLHLRRGSFTLALDVALPAGRAVAVFGPSGAGKSTFLRLLTGLTPADRAAVSWQGHVWAAQGRPPLPPWQRPLAYLTQDPGLALRRSALQNLLLVPGATPSAASHALARCGFHQDPRRPVRDLSGGERATVAFARVLLRNAPLTLLDEPWAGLDATTRTALGDLARAHLCGEGRLLLFVSHDWLEVERLADHVLLFEDGRLRQQGSPAAVVAAPATPRLARLMGYRGFSPDGRGGVLGVHPARLLAGARPEAGPVLPVLAARTTQRAGLPVWALTLPGGVEVELSAPSAPTAVTLLAPPTYQEGEL